MKKLITIVTVLGLMISPAMAADKKGSMDKKDDSGEKKVSVDKPSEKATAVAKTLTPAQSTKLMDILNSGDEKAVQSLPGVGPVSGAALIKGRPYTGVLDILKVDGIGDGTLTKMVAHAKAGFPIKEADSDAKKPASGKAEEGKGKAKKSSKSESTKKEE